MIDMKVGSKVKHLRLGDGTVAADCGESRLTTTLQEAAVVFKFFAFASPL